MTDAATVAARMGTRAAERYAQTGIFPSNPLAAVPALARAFDRALFAGIAAARK